jgi:putative SOS response-associated peptidase YedK
LAKKYFCRNANFRQNCRESVRKGLTTEPNAIVAPIHAKAMPVILTTQEEIDGWMKVPAPPVPEFQNLYAVLERHPNIFDCCEADAGG